jgi:hypothetical protein
VRMKLVAPPLYVLTTATLDKAKGVEVRTMVSLTINNNVLVYGMAFARRCCCCCLCSPAWACMC